MGLVLLAAGAAGYWAWKTGKLRSMRVGDVAAAVAMLIAVRFFSRGDLLSAVVAAGGAGFWLWLRTRSNGRMRDRGMSPARARALLEVGRGASVAEIRAAHRRLMMRVHPDAGGSTQLAVEINAARDALLATEVKR
ncbi:MAG: molecular chaperone DnaJ [Sphingomonas sp.]|nr:MAG: molecular chaperone DnaJ [Sphingomonas sp.]